MAKRRKSSTRTITRTVTPTVKVSVPRAAPLARKHKVKHRRRSAAASGTSVSSLMADAVVGYVMGYLDKTGTAVPTVPVLGRAGTLAVGCYFFRGSMPILRRAVAPLVSIAAYEMGRDGKIAGDVEGSVMGYAHSPTGM